MSDYSAVAPPQNFNQSSAFAAALQRARQIAAKINPNSASSTGTTDSAIGQKRPLEESSVDFEPDSKKVATLASPPLAASAPSSVGAGGVGGLAGGVTAAVAARVAAGIQGLAALGGPVSSEDIKVPDKMVGLIIGRGGEQISRLQSESGCKIQMAPDSGGTPERLCTLTGNPQAIGRAKELIGSIVAQRSRTEGTGGARLDEMGLGGLDSSMGSNGGNNGDGHSSGSGGNAHVEIMVPGPKVGLIIGKGGETIKQLQEKSGAKMVVIQEGPNQETEKPLRISGDVSKVEAAKQLVYELIADKEGGSFGGRSGLGGNNQRSFRSEFGSPFGQSSSSGGDGDSVEIAVPRAAVGVVIGKGGDMIKKIQGETGARVQFQQGREDDPDDRRCFLSGKPDQVSEARRRIDELIDSVLRRDNDRGRGGGRGGFERSGGRDFNDRGGRGGGWNNDRGDKQEATFVVPANKCGVIIGRGGETIKQINQSTGAHCELDRRPQANPAEKTFLIRGQPDQIEAAKRLIAEKLGGPGGGLMSGGQGQNGGGPPFGGAGGPPGGGASGAPHFAPQSWGSGGPQGFQQPWANPQQPHPQDPNMFAAAQNNQVQVPVNPQTGQPDYSAQWAEYYRSVGMHREAELIEQQAKASKGMTAVAVAGGQGAPQQQPSQPAPAAAQPAQNGQPDYSAQWAEYYRSTGKIKEAEFIEQQMKTKAQAAVGGAVTAATSGQTGASAPNPYAQPQPQPYGYGATTAGFYQSTPQAPTQQATQPQYPSYPGYAQPYHPQAQGQAAPPDGQ
ncbi:far upstream element-binding protein 3 [Nilaparvata lugens]|uniref:far upstream element-binding protein 3 n=1 Tax=Nilaparvata lugens TaxID=108931 RepID=UPI00193D2DB0|nr:far upstream element-binding protein 3 [Nilaparvata lugens]XP_039298561.1 far upstream element-binding protein 3 [Nilaparvata lugens]XP_039298562.1 far upstream element-binding protein 3 [Nilaparvata lugens]